MVLGQKTFTLYQGFYLPLPQICVETPELIALECKGPSIVCEPGRLGFHKGRRMSNVLPLGLLVSNFCLSEGSISQGAISRDCWYVCIVLKSRRKSELWMVLMMKWTLPVSYFLRTPLHCDQNQAYLFCGSYLWGLWSWCSKAAECINSEIFNFKSTLLSYNQHITNDTFKSLQFKGNKSKKWTNLTSNCKFLHN